MTRRNRFTLGLGIVLAVFIVAAAWVIRTAYFAPKTITAHFTAASALYVGDDVRVLGVKVGTITAIQTRATDVELTLHIDRDVPIPADAKAVIAAPNLLAARYVQLTPAYSAGVAAMSDGAVIPVERTAVPVEWDEVKTQLMHLATDLGPNSNVSTPAVARLINSAANAMGGNGGKLRDAIAELSQVSRTLADGGGNIVDIIKSLQTLVTALSGSAPQIVSLENRLATLTSVLNDSRSDLEGTLTNMSSAVVDVQRFVKGSSGQTAEALQRLANVTQNLVDHQSDLENLLHVLPNFTANTYNAYNPDTGNLRGTAAFANFSSPLDLICGAIGSLENTTAAETGKLCAQYLGPALRSVSLNSLPFPMNPYLMKSASPDNIIYSAPGLAPGGAGGSPAPAVAPPAVSAYTGSGDVAPPAGFGSPPGPPGLYAPEHLPAAPFPALYPGAPIPPGVAGLPAMLLPAEAPPLPSEASPPGAGTP